MRYNCIPMMIVHTLNLYLTLIIFAIKKWIDIVIREDSNGENERENSKLCDKATGKQQVRSII